MQAFQRASTRPANQAVVSLRLIFGLCRSMSGTLARGTGLPAPAWSAIAYTPR